MRRGWLIAGVVAALLALLAPPLGAVAIAIGIVALITGATRVGALLVVLGVVLPLPGAFVFQALLLKPYRVPSESMLPTLAAGDRFVAWRHGAPAVGDVVVLRPPAGAEALDGPRCGARHRDDSPCPRPTPARADIEIVKRIVAGPGARVSIRGGHVRVDGRRRREPFVAPCDGGAGCDLPRPITVPPGHWFMMGDNRGASDDSRSWGPVPTAWIIGRAVARYWPLDRAGGL